MISNYKNLYVHVLENKEVNEDKNKNPPDSKHIIILCYDFLKYFYCACFI